MPHEITDDGFERTFQVNHLSHFFLTQLLRKHLLMSAPSRVIVVSSESHRFSSLSNSNFSRDFFSPKTDSNFSSMRAYNDTKLCNVLFAMENNRRFASRNVFTNSLHPGNMMSTNLSRNWWVYRLAFALVRPFTKSAVRQMSS